MPEISTISTSLPATLPAMIPLENHRYKLDTNPRKLAINLSDLLSFCDQCFPGQLTEKTKSEFDPYIQFNLVDPYHEIILCGLKRKDIKNPKVISVNKFVSSRYMAQIINNSIRTLAISIDYLESRAGIVFGDIDKEEIQINFTIPFVKLVRKS